MKKLYMAILLVLTLVILSSCGNNKSAITDIHYTFTKAHIKLGNTWVEIGIKEWLSYGSHMDEIQLTADDGTIYMTHFSNVVLVSK